MTTSESPSASGHSRRALRFIVPVAILIVGAAAFAALKLTKEAPARVERTSQGPLVETLDCAAGLVQVTVEAQGNVRPATEIDLVPQVSGIVIWKSPLLESGGYFRRGDLLAQIDPVDFELAVEVAEAELARAQFSLEMARGEARVARAEWERMTTESAADQSGESVNPLVLHIPQIKVAEATLQAARARRDEARLRLERTNLRASFDGRVRQTSLDQGQYVSMGQPVARLYSIERAEIVVPVPDEELAWLELPNSATGFSVPHPPAQTATAAEVVRPGAGENRDRPAESSPEVLVSGRYGGRQHEWSGRLVRAEGEFDRQSRMVNLIVEVDDPYGTGSAPLTAGMFVDVAIKGPQAVGVRTLPRAALRANNTVWTAGAEGLLRVRHAEIVRKQGDQVLVLLDMPDDEGVIVSQLQGSTDGMKVRVNHKETVQ